MKNIDELIKNNRTSIKPNWQELRFLETPRKQGKPRPTLYKQAKEDAVIIRLINEFPNIKHKTLTECIKTRRSLRQYSNVPFTFEELSYVMWETSRIDYHTDSATFRTIPTGGATNAMETYVMINNVEGMNPGVYHYIQDKHILALIDEEDSIQDRTNKALSQQLRGAAIVLILTAVPYRSEYKYSFTAHKMIAMEAGHSGQNASLVAENLDAGAVCLAAYNQLLLDELLKIDGVDEFATYAIPMGKK